LAPDAAAEVNAPDPIGAALEPQRLERNPHLNRPSVAAAFRCDGPDRVPAWIHLPPFIRDLRVELRADGVGHEDEAVAAIGEGVEDQLEAVLLGGIEVFPDVDDDE